MFKVYLTDALYSYTAMIWPIAVLRTYLLKYSGKDSVDICLEPTECWEGTESNLDDPKDEDEINGFLVFPLELVNKLPTDSNFSAKPLICKVSAVWKI